MSIGNYQLDRIRAAMVLVFGGMDKGSLIWSQGQWEKGWTAGVQAALKAFDTERKKLDSEITKEIGDTESVPVVTK
jgi:hypothetical protein